MSQPVFGPIEEAALECAARAGVTSPAGISRVHAASDEEGLQLEVIETRLEQLEARISSLETALSGA
jgi:hypothetical protein